MTQSFEYMERILVFSLLVAAAKSEDMWIADL